MKIVSNFPKGYIKAESKFCKKEEDDLFNSKLPPFHEDKIRARNILLSKRAEFKRIWNKRKNHEQIHR